MKKTVAAIVVTYNRKESLIVALESIFLQSIPPEEIIIVNNKSTDGTLDSLFSNGIVLPSMTPLLDAFGNTVIKNKIFKNSNYFDITLIEMSQNVGGAGGFYEGMKKAYESGVDLIWMMDDDGVPKRDQLEQLVYSQNQYNLDFLNALVVDLNDEKKLAFGLGTFEKVNDIGENLIIKDLINPFNGTLITRTLIDTIGFVKREMFIWGDESEFSLRAKKNGFKVATVVSAVHYHPKNKGITKKIFPFLSKSPQIVVKPEHLSKYYYRNLGFISHNYFRKRNFVFIFILYTVYFFSRFRFKEAAKFVKYFIYGKNGRFE